MLWTISSLGAPESTLVDFHPHEQVRAETRKDYSVHLRLQNCVVPSTLNFCMQFGWWLKIGEDSQLWNDRISNLFQTGELFSFFENWPALKTRSLACVASCPRRMFLAARAGQEQKGLSKAIPFLRPFCAPGHKDSRQATRPLPGDRAKAILLHETPRDTLISRFSMRVFRDT